MDAHLETRLMTFLIRMSCDAAGRLRGVIERVSTGEKEAFADVCDVAAILERIARHELET